MRLLRKRQKTLGSYFFCRTLYVQWRKFHMQLVHVYLNWFWRNSLLKCVLQPKIAKKSP